MDSVQKGKNTFLVYQEQKQIRRERLIRNYLQVLKGSRVRFKYVTDLAKMIAIHIGEAEGSSCDKATLLRNPRYKSLLLSFLADEARVGRPASKEDSPKAIKSSDIRQLQLTNRNLLGENQRLKDYISFNSQAPKPLVKAISQPAGAVEIDFQEKYVLTCQALFRILEALRGKGYIEASTQNRRIIDVSRLVNNVIVDERISHPYFEWLFSAGLR